MAEKRMFSKTIIDSDAFMDMPLSAQCLYFHLSMRADDDGFVNNPRKIMRMIGCADDDIKLLIAKQFLLIFDSGVVVIKHWRIHNYIQKDRYKPTLCTKEYGKLFEDETKAYTVEEPCIQHVNTLDTDCIQSGYRMDTDCIQPVNGMDTQYRLGKPRLDQPRLDQDQKRAREENPFGGELDIPAEDNDTARVVKAYNQQIGQIPGGKAWELLCSYIEDIGADAVIVAIEETNLAQPSGKWNYLKRILDSFAEKGIKDADAARGAINDHKTSVNASKQSGVKTAAESKPKFNYQQHTYTDADFEDFYFDPAEYFKNRDKSEEQTNAK